MVFRLLHDPSQSCPVVSFPSFVHSFFCFNGGTKMVGRLTEYQDKGGVEPKYLVSI